MVTNKNIIKADRCHIIIGGGSAGILLCHQLLEHGDDVILIERGSRDPISSAVAARIPSQWPAAAISLGEATRHCTLPQTRLGKREIMYPQGSGIGGTSNINAMIWSAGHPAVFDRFWPEMWNSEAIDSLFRTVISVIKPDVTYSPLLEHLLANSIHCQQACESAPQFGRSIDPRSKNQYNRLMVDKSELIWDIDPVKATYLSTINSISNERISMKDVLSHYQQEFEGGAKVKKATDIPLIKEDEKNKEIESCRGKLTIFEYSTVLSIEFDDCREIGKVFVQDPAVGEDTDLTKTRSGGMTADKTIKAKLVAVGVRYVARPYMGRIKRQNLEMEVRTIAPKGGGEIILCAGVFESPRILISSGLGVKNCRHKSAVLNVKSVAEVSDDVSSDAPIQTAAKDAKKSIIVTNDESKSPTPVPISSFCAYPPLLSVTLKGIGRNLQDHTVLPIMCVGNWWTIFKSSNRVSIRDNIIKNIGSTQDFNTFDWSDYKNDDTDSITGSVCRDINRKDCTVHRDSILSRMSSEVMHGALGMIIVGTIGILSLVGTYFYSLYQPHSDSKLFDVSSLINIREYFLFHSLINHAVSAQSNESIWWERSWVHFAFTILLAILSLFILIKISNGLEGSSKQRKGEGEGEGAEEGLTRHGNRASIYPLNCVHGYVNLDEMGNVLQRNSSKPPSTQLLLVDGSLAPAYLLPELLLPRYSPRSTYVSYIFMMIVRPCVTLILRALLLLPPCSAAAGCVFGFLVCSVQPHSKGLLYQELDSCGRVKDLTAPLLIDHGLLSDERDVTAMYHAMKTARKLLTGQPLYSPSERPCEGSTQSLSASTSDVGVSAPICSASPISLSSSATALGVNTRCEDFSGFQTKNPHPVWCFEILPGPLFGNTEIMSNFMSYCKSYVTTYFHACGSCAMETPKTIRAEKKGGDDAKMKGDIRECNISPHPPPNKEDNERCDGDKCEEEEENMSVVDIHFRVRGVLNLRVVDASVFPRIPSGPTSATCMAMGVAAAALIIAENNT